MANTWTALHTFWNSFSLTAYDENTVPDDAQMPYITYEAQTSGLGDVLLLSGSLWYKSTSWAQISNKAEAISDIIGGGMGIPYDNGRLWVTKAIQFANRMSEPDDDSVRRIVLRINAEFQTAN